MSRSLAIFACLVVTLVAAVDAQARPPGVSWAQSHIRFVVARGLMAEDVASFRPDDTLTRGELAALVTALNKRPAAGPVDPAEPRMADPRMVSVAQLDARLVGALGLSSSAATFLSGARGAGLTVTGRFGTEVVARLLGLRTNHPNGQDDLELAPADPVTRAETAFSAARILRLSPRDAEHIETAADTFALPSLTGWQKRVLGTAAALIGHPYVWAGTSEFPEGPLGPQIKGGFDCSGFAWRVFKVQAYPSGAALAKTLRGRTAAAMAGEVPAARRIAFVRLAPADLVFFAPGGSRAKAGAVDHMGVYLGSGWMIHSSRYGVALAPISSGWYREHFAWGRRPLAEAGLA